MVNRQCFGRGPVASDDDDAFASCTCENRQPGSGVVHGQLTAHPQILDRLPMTIDCLKESGIGKEVKRVSKSSSSNSGECPFLGPIRTQAIRRHHHLPFPTRIQWFRSQKHVRVALSEFQSIVVWSVAIMYLTTPSVQRAQRLGTWHQTSLLNGVRSSLPV